jgi:hypothetical protein
MGWSTIKERVLNGLNQFWFKTNKLQLVNPKPKKHNQMMRFDGIYPFWLDGYGSRKNK